MSCFPSQDTNPELVLRTTMIPLIVKLLLTSDKETWAVTQGEIRQICLDGAQEPRKVQGSKINLRLYSRSPANLRELTRVSGCITPGSRCKRSHRNF